MIISSACLHFASEPLLISKTKNVILLQQKSNILQGKHHQVRYTHIRSYASNAVWRTSHRIARYHTI
jgi:hypothetical protein